MPRPSLLHTKVVLLDPMPEGEWLREAIGLLAEGAWCVQGGPPGRRLTCFVTNRPRGAEMGANALYLAEQQSIRISLPMLRLKYPGGRLVRALVRAVVHEVTHARLHAERALRGEAERQVEHASRAEYLEDPEEREARRAETAVEAALYPGLGILPRPDRPLTLAVSASEAAAYQEALGERLPRLLRALEARSERRALRGVHPLTGGRGSGPVLIPTRSQTAPTPRLDTFFAEMRAQAPGWEPPELMSPERETLEATLHALRQQSVFSYLEEMQADYGLQPWWALEPGAWRSYVERVEEGERALLRERLFQAGGDLGQWGWLRGRLHGSLLTLAEALEARPRLREAREEAAAFYNQVVLGEAPPEAEGAPLELAAEEMRPAWRGWLARAGEEARTLGRLGGLAYNGLSAPLGLPRLDDLRERLAQGGLRELPEEGAAPVRRTRGRGMTMQTLDSLP